MAIRLNRRFQPPIIDLVLAADSNGVGIVEKREMLQGFRSQSPDASRSADQALLERLQQLHTALREAQENLHKFRTLLQQAMTPPWHTGVFLSPLAPTSDGTPRVMLFHAGGRRVVSLAEGLETQNFALGDEVFLNHERTSIVAKSPFGPSVVGDVATFERHVGDGRAALRARGKELVVQLTDPVRQIELKTGDQLRIDRTVGLAYERIEDTAGRRYLLEEVADVGPEQVGGQRANLEHLFGALTTALVSPEKAAAYGLNGRRSILMVGPPGCGKTLMARAAAAEIRRSSGRNCQFAVVKPAEWEDPYVGVTQQNIRKCFADLREGAQDGLAVVFLDEIECVGRLRGSAVGHHSDKFLAALLAELDGFSGRSNVAIISATNRKDLVDPALLERISDVEIQIRRPDMRAAREILAIHLPTSTPFSPNGDMTLATRSELIDRAVSMLYAPNAENEICTIKFRDGKTRSIVARELLSGRLLEQICRAARQAAFLRDVQNGQAGVQITDMEDAISDALKRLATTLTPRNAHAYLSDLPQDLDVVAVEPVVRRVSHGHRYLNSL